MTNIGIITVRDRAYHPNRRLMEAAIDQGHEITLIHPYRLWPLLAGNKPDVFGQPEMGGPDVVLPRQGATIGDSCQALIAPFSLMGIPVVNNLTSIRLAKNQFHTLQTLAAACIPVPDTLFINSFEGIQNAVDQVMGFPVVVKPVSGRQGEGVILVESLGHLEAVTQKILDERIGFLIQRFIPPTGRRDIRVLVVGGKVVGAMELKPAPGDFRANYHLTKNSHRIDISSPIQEIALRAACALGLQIAGIDLITAADGRTLVIEANYSPGFKGMEAATGLDMAAAIVGYVSDITRR